MERKLFAPLVALAVIVTFAILVIAATSSAALAQAGAFNVAAGRLDPPAGGRNSPAARCAVCSDIGQPAGLFVQAGFGACSLVGNDLTAAR